MKRPIKKKISKRKAWLGWHFANETETLRFGDGRKIEVGTTHKVDCTPIMRQETFCSECNSVEKSFMATINLSPHHESIWPA